MQEVSSKYIIDLVIVITLVFAISGVFLVSYIISYNKRKKKFTEEKEKFQNQLLQTQLEIQEQTLQQVSQEIHDNTSQLLGLIKLNLATANPANEAQTREKINSAHELVTQVIGGIRQLSHTLDTGFVERLGLQEAIRYQLELVEKTGQYTVSFQCNGEPQKTDPQKELILFRMVQESLNNTIKHAKASEITVQLNYVPGLVSIVIADNGEGFEPQNNKTGIGLQNMHNRAQLIGATLHIHAEKNKGATIKIDLPV